MATPNGSGVQQQQASSSQFFYAPKFSGMNLLSPRQQINDYEFSWLENFLPVSDEAMQAVPGPSPSMGFTISGQNPSRMWHIAFNGNDYLLVFTAQGRLYLVNLITGTQTRIGASFTFSLPDACVWKSTTLLIADPTAGYCSWDGTTFTQIDATANAYQLIAVFQGRVWFIQNNTTILATAPDSITDFNVADGAFASSIYQDGLRRQVFHIQPGGDYLYFVGDGGVYAACNVAATSFQLVEVVRNHGTTFYAAVDFIDRTLIFAANDNIYGINGFYPVALAPSLAPLFSSFSVSGALHLSLATIYGCQVLCVRATYADPVVGPRAVFVGLFQGKVFLLSQTPTITYTATVELANVFITYATDGDSVFPLFQDPTVELSFKAQTKMYALGAPVILKEMVRAGVEQVPTLATGTMTLQVDTDYGSDAPFSVLNLQVLTFLNNSNAAIQFQNNSGGNIYFVVGGPSVGGMASQTKGRYFGATLIGTAPGIQIGGFIFEYKPGGPWP